MTYHHAKRISLEALRRIRSAEHRLAEAQRLERVKLGVAALTGPPPSDWHHMELTRDQFTVYGVKLVMIKLEDYIIKMNADISLLRQRAKKIKARRVAKLIKFIGRHSLEDWPEEQLVGVDIERVPDLATRIFVQFARHVWEHATPIVDPESDVSTGPKDWMMYDHGDHLWAEYVWPDSAQFVVRAEDYGTSAKTLRAALWWLQDAYYDEYSGCAQLAKVKDVEVRYQDDHDRQGTIVWPNEVGAYILEPPPFIQHFVWVCKVGTQFDWPNPLRLLRLSQRHLHRIRFELSFRLRMLFGRRRSKPFRSGKPCFRVPTVRSPC